MSAITDRIDNVTRIPDNRLVPELPVPRSVKIEISPRCNYRCGFCAAHWTMGDLTHVAFMQAWNSAAFVTLREAHLRRDVRGTACEMCVAYS